VRIIGPPTGVRADVCTRLQALGATTLFTEQMLPPLWNAAINHVLDPVGVVAQSYKETGGGTFGGRVKPEFFNTCGLKNRQSLFPGIDDGDNPLAHARFASWEIGAEAHIQHLCAYAGWPVYGLIVDPRYVFVAGKSALENFEELSGKWAPSATYGQELVAIARKLQA
jgi:N-acetylmuramoyl-L-alanine amidase